MDEGDLQGHRLTLGDGDVQALGGVPQMLDHQDLGSDGNVVQEEAAGAIREGPEVGPLDVDLGPLDGLRRLPRP